MYVQHETAGFLFEIDCIPFLKSKYFSWRRGKRFKKGSLILFSKDDFKSFKTGIIREADGSEMDFQMNKFGFCNIFVEVVNSDDPLIFDYEEYKNKELVIIENKCFFEAIIHTLKTLKEIKYFPFESIILGDDHIVNRAPITLTQRTLCKKIIKHYKYFPIENRTTKRRRNLNDRLMTRKNNKKYQRRVLDSIEITNDWEFCSTEKMNNLRKEFPDK